MKPKRYWLILLGVTILVTPHTTNAFWGEFRSGFVDIYCKVGDVLTLDWCEEEKKEVTPVADTNNTSPEQSSNTYTRTERPPVTEITYQTTPAQQTIFQGLTNADLEARLETFRLSLPIQTQTIREIETRTSGGGSGGMSSGDVGDLIRKHLSSAYDQLSENISDISDTESFPLLSGVGALSSGSIVNGFGNIDIGANTLSAGATTLASLSVSGNLTVSGAQTLSGALGAAYFTATDANATSTFAGNVGIGTTTAPYKLAVIGDTYIKGNLRINGSAEIRENGDLTVGDKVIAPGDIMLGTTVSFAKLSLQNTLADQTGFAIKGHDAQTSPLLDVFDNATNNNSLFRITSDGRVGVGTTTPSSSLSVVGDGQFTGSLSLAQIINNSPAPKNYFWTDRDRSGDITDTTSAGNVLIGTNAYNTLSIHTQGQYASVNTVIGTGAMSLANATRQGHTVIGAFALLRANGNDNTAVGRGAGMNNQSAGLSILGAYAASGASAYNQPNTTAIGFRSLQSLTTGAGHNTGLGNLAGSVVSSGAYNTLLGSLAGSNITTGSSNIMIGYNALAPSATSSNQLNIGNVIYGDLSTGRVGVGTSTPLSKLHIEGNQYIAGLTTFKDTINIQMSTSTTPSDTQILDDALESIAIGAHNSITGHKGIAIGTNNTAGAWFSNGRAIAIGDNNSSGRATTLSIGYNNTAGGGSNSLAIGVGNTTSASNNAAFAIGWLSTASGAGSLAVGRQVTASGLSSVALGHSAAASGNYAVALGYFAAASGNYAVGVGYAARAQAAQSLALGRDSWVTSTGTNGASVGPYTKVEATGASAFGTSVVNNIANSTMIGPSDSAKITILESGNLGIGTTAPAYNLDIFNSSTPTLSLSTASHQWRMAIGSGATAGNLNFTKTGLSTPLAITSTGNVGIGTTTPPARLSVTQSANNATGGFYLAESGNTDFRSAYMDTNGVMSFYGGDTSGTLNTATLNAAGEWTNASDRAYKDNIEDLAYGLDEILQLQPRSYTIKDTNIVRLGFIAQEMELVLPELVSGVEGKKGISYGNLTSVLVKAIQELSKKIDEFRTKEFRTEKLCVGDVCVTETQLLDMLQSSGYSKEPEAESTPEPEPEIVEEVPITPEEVPPVVEDPVTEPEPEPLPEPEAEPTPEPEQEPEPQPEPKAPEKPAEEIANNEAIE